MMSVHPTAFVHPTVETLPYGYVEIGAHSFIGPDVKLLCDNIIIGAFSKIHNGTVVHGRKETGTLKMGDACWVGSHCVLDTEGGLSIEDFVTIGAHTCVWTHRQFGDYTQGAPKLELRRRVIAQDAWIGCNSVVAVDVPRQALLIAGSVATRYLDSANKMYAGNPAVSIGKEHMTELPATEKYWRARQLVLDWEYKNPSRKGDILVVFPGFDSEEGNNWINPITRRYAHDPSGSLVKFLEDTMPLIRLKEVS